MPEISGSDVVVQLLIWFAHSDRRTTPAVETDSEVPTDVSRLLFRDDPSTRNVSRCFKLIKYF